MLSPALPPVDKEGCKAPLFCMGTMAKSAMKETPIVQYLRSLPQGKKIYFFANPGSAGDSMIALSTYQLFRQLGIDYCIVDRAQAFDPTGKFMVYSGGGNLVEYYNTARKLIQKYYPFVEKLVILPHTIYENEGLLGEFQANVDIICREPVSFAHVRKYAPRANVLLMDDLAFSLDTDSVLRPGTRAISFIKDRSLRKWVLRDLILGILLPIRQLPGKFSRQGNWMILNTFRKDVESSHHFLPPDNVDLATLFGYGTNSERIAFYVTYRILKTLNRYRTVRTDRLHVCIAAALLGKTVEFFPNNYFKCEAIYQYSMKDKFPNVRWMG
jgi:exopolysaccharide biosynthesis predicted pyruvyltransferase EpsI